MARGCGADIPLNWLFVLIIWSACLSLVVFAERERRLRRVIPAERGQQRRRGLHFQRRRLCKNSRRAVGDAAPNQLLAAFSGCGAAGPISAGHSRNAAIPRNRYSQNTANGQPAGELRLDCENSRLVFYTN